MMDELLAELNMVIKCVVYMDDILILVELQQRNIEYMRIAHAWSPKVVVTVSTEKLSRCC